MPPRSPFARTQLRSAIEQRLTGLLLAWPYAQDNILSFFALAVQGVPPEDMERIVREWNSLPREGALDVTTVTDGFFGSEAIAAITQMALSNEAVIEVTIMTHHPVSAVTVWQGSYWDFLEDLAEVTAYLLDYANARGS